MTSIASQLALPASRFVLRNRLLKAAMSEGLATREGAPSEGLIRLYERWARGGAAALITGNVMIDASAMESPRNVLIEDDRHREALRRWANAAHRHHAAIIMQLNHAGRQALRRGGSPPIAPFALKPRGLGPLVAKPRAATAADIEDVIARFLNAALIASEAGFDGVQIHAAHGYLLSQFLSPLANRRDDEWGGDLAGRMRLLLEVVGRVRESLPKDRILSVKLNSADFQRGGFDNDDALEVSAALERLDVDFIEISGGNYESPAMVGASSRAREAYFADFSAKLSARVKVPVMLTGGLRTAATMNEVLASGAADLIGLARPLAVEPDLAARLIADPSGGAHPVDLATGTKALDSVIEVMWYARQIERMAQGREPSATLSRVTSLVRGVFRTYSPRCLAPTT